MLEYFITDYVNLTHGFIYLTANYFVAGCIPLLLGDFSKKPFWKTALITVAEILICIIVMEFFAAVYFAVFNSDTYVPFVCGLLVLVLYAAFRCKRKPALRVMQCSAYMGLSCLALSTTMSMGSLLGVPYYYLQWVLISLNGIMIMSVVIALRYFSVKNETPVQLLFVLLVCAVGAICYAFAILRRALRIDPAASIAMCLIFIFVYLIVYFTASYFMKKSYDDACRQADEIMRGSDREAFRMSNENLETLHRMRHELKNQYALMKTYLDSGDYVRLRRYFSEFSDKIEETVNFEDCGNDTLNAIISIERGRARGAGVELDCKIAVPRKLNIKDVDLCSLLMNLINNAIEYYERGGEQTDKRISLEMFLVNSTLMVKVSNPVLPEHAEKALTLKTSKKNKNMHGYGSKIVAGIVEKYNGTISYGMENDEFTVDAMLFIPPVKDKNKGEGEI